MILALLFGKSPPRGFTMDRQTDVNHANNQLERARELLAEGQHQEALVLALDALQTVLHNLRESLVNFQRNLAQAQEEKGQVELSQQELESLSSFVQRKSRIYH
jgi:predicted RNA-binding Zn ribbon-like protein